MRLEALKKIAKGILDLEGVVGIGSSRGLKIFVESEEYADAVPTALAGRPVEVVVTGRLRAMPLTIEERQSVVRPLVGGISVGNERVTGTLGIVHDGYIISNAHVLAMDENGNFLRGARIVQPGPQDGGGEAVGELLGYTRFQFNDVAAENYADFAVAVATAEHVNDTIAGTDKDYTVSMRPYEPKEGEIVRKTGRTTGTTYGTVASTSAVVRVWYSDDKWAAFHDVVLVKGDPFMRGGDSGSFVDRDGRFVGLGFAGNEETGYAVVCKAKYVLYAFRELTLPTEEARPSLVPVMAFALPLAIPVMAAGRRRF